MSAFKGQGMVPINKNADYYCTCQSVDSLRTIVSATDDGNIRDVGDKKNRLNYDTSLLGFSYNCLKLGKILKNRHFSR